MSNSKLIGTIVGLFLVAIIMVILLKFVNKDSSIKTKYDERQQIVRGKAYRLSYWTLVILLAIYCILVEDKMELPIQKNLIPFIIVLISVLVHAVYAIINDGYFGLNESRRKVMFVFLFIGLLNFGVAFMEIKRGQMMEDGKLSTPFINLCCGFMFVIIGIVLIIKNITTKEDIEEE